MDEPMLIGDILAELGFLPTDADRQGLRLLRREVRDAGSTSLRD